MDWNWFASIDKAYLPHMTIIAISWVADIEQSFIDAGAYLFLIKLIDLYMLEKPLDLLPSLKFEISRLYEIYRKGTAA